MELELSRLRHPPPLEVLWKEAAEHAELSPETLHSGGRSVRGVEVWEGFMWRAGCEAGYRAVAAFVGCPASPVSRALERR